MMKNLLKCIVVFYSNLLAAQMPDTEVWVFNLTKDKSGKTILTEPRNISNRKGYDNQPSFSPDGRYVYYASVREDKQSDIYRCKSKGGESQKISSSIESEYSPAPLPESKDLSAVVVEKDSAQRVHFIDPETGGHKRKLDFDSVGYCLFLNTDTVIYYKLTAPHSLRYHVLSSHEDRFICNNPIRSIKTVNRHCFLFGIKDSSGCNYYHYDFLLRKATKVGGSTLENEDINWHPAWGLLMARDSRILQFDSQSQAWVTLFDLTTFGIKKTGRFCFDSQTKYLAIVEVR